MQLIFFDLDGTLLDASSQISPFTSETLGLLKEKNIAYTVATGRTMLSALPIMQGHGFELPQIYNNGVTVWHPKNQHMALENVLDRSDISTVLNVVAAHGITPFVHVIDHDQQHYIYHSDIRHDVENHLVYRYFSRINVKLLPLNELLFENHTFAKNNQVTNISMIGENKKIYDIWLEVNAHQNLIAYSGPALEGKQYSWMDVHHRLANKGSAVSSLKKQLGIGEVICFGDSDNDLSMFAAADESYAPSNAIDEVKDTASAVIGHNHQDGVAHFLRERFSL